MRDAKSVLASLEPPVVALDRKLRLRYFTAAVTRHDHRSGCSRWQGRAARRCDSISSNRGGTPRRCWCRAPGSSLTAEVMPDPAAALQEELDHHDGIVVLLPTAKSVAMIGRPLRGNPLRRNRTWRGDPRTAGARRTARGSAKRSGPIGSGFSAPRMNCAARGRTSTSASLHVIKVLETEMDSLCELQNSLY